MAQCTCFDTIWLVPVSWPGLACPAPQVLRLSAKRQCRWYLEEYNAAGGGVQDRHVCYWFAEDGSVTGRSHNYVDPGRFRRADLSKVSNRMVGVRDGIAEWLRP